MKRKIALTIFIVLTLSLAAAFLPACNKTPKYTVSDIYKSHAQESGFTSATKILDFPEGVKPYGGKSSKINYANAYLPSVNCLVVQKTDGSKLLGLYDLKGKEVLPINFTEISVKQGYILAREQGGNVILAGPNGEVVLSATPKDSGYEIKNAKGETLALSLNFDTSNDMSLLIRPMSAKYVAVRTNVQKVAFVGADGQIVAATEYEGNMSEFKTVDDYVVRSFTENSLPTVCVYRIGEKAVVSGGRIVAATEDAVLNVTYVGGNNFYCAEMVKLAKSSASDETAEEDYDYIDLSGNKCKISIFGFNAKTGEKKTMSDEMIFSSIVNGYYEEESGIEISKYLNDGFSYVSVGLVKTDGKKTQFEAFIIDENFNVVASMTTEYGKFNPSADGTAYRDMLIEYSGGIGIGVTNEKGPLAVYDRNGKCVLFKDDASYSKISFGGGVVTALKTAADGTARYVAYGLDGSEIVGFEQGFTALTKFVGGYAVGVAKNYSSSTDCLIVAADGKVYPSQTYASKSTYFYCPGAQVSKNSEGKFGLLSVAEIPVLLVDYVADNVILTNYDGGVVIYYTEIGGAYSAYLLNGGTQG
ncbi:unknown [Faecalibacterium sp. CAG:1138]|nr:unknown [Faecalibacterium sp. CAG:1138]